MFGRLALHTWSIDTTPLAEAIAAARAGGFDAIELRRIDFVRCHQRGMRNEQVCDLVRAGGLPVHMMGSEHGFLFARGEESRRLFDVLEETCENAVALDCPMLMTSPGAFDGTRDEAVENLKRGADICGKYGLQLALEFNWSHASLYNIGSAREIVARADRPNLGLLLDAYHLQRAGVGGRGFADLAPDEIFAFQYSDVPADTGAPFSPTDRLPPGQGVGRWLEMFQLLHEKGFAGHLSFEAPNPQAWARPPGEVCREAAEATRAFVAQVLAAQGGTASIPAA